MAEIDYGRDSYHLTPHRLIRGSFNSQEYLECENARLTKENQQLREMLKGLVSPKHLIRPLGVNKK